MPRLRLFLVGALLALTLPSARAHDPFENTVDLAITPDALEVTAVLSPPSSTGLLKTSGAVKITKDNFASHRAVLLEAAARVCVLLDTDGKLITPARTYVSLNLDGEVTYLFEYPASTRPASLHSDLIASLGSGYFVAVTDRTLSPAKRVVLVRAKPACALPVSSRQP